MKGEFQFVSNIYNFLSKSQKGVEKCRKFKQTSFRNADRGFKLIAALFSADYNSPESVAFLHLPTPRTSLSKPQSPHLLQPPLLVLGLQAVSLQALLQAQKHMSRLSK